MMPGRQLFARNGRFVYVLVVVELKYRTHVKRSQNQPWRCSSVLFWMRVIDNCLVVRLEW